MAGGVLRFVLGDQLSRDVSSLEDLDAARDVVLLAEVSDETTYVRHHPKKIAFILSAMRHFAAALTAEGVAVDYVTLDDPDNTSSFRGEMARAVARHGATRVVVTEPGEYRVRADMDTWPAAVGVPVEIRDDTRFLCTHAEFDDWAAGRKQLRMELFYRHMRQRTGVLMTGEREPVGGRWNFDADNRRRLPDGLKPPAPHRVVPDDTTRAVLDLVRTRFCGRHIGALEPFWFAVTTAEAEAAFERFVEQALPLFGDYQDAMKQGEPTLYHAVISLYLNIGLLSPKAVIARVERAYRDGDAPLNAVEGFIRQVLGWREYVRGIYWRAMPAYAATNALAAHRPLPSLYWTGETDLNCLRQSIEQTWQEAYAHHIQRLMILGNFALLIGAEPKEVCAWYLIVYADAFEWVELPNTHGMALFADGGVMASKPYAASGAYIDRMSDYCRHCAYDVRQKTGPKACPFNSLYWNFLIENRDRLDRNQRLTMVYRTLDRMTPERVTTIRADAARFLARLYHDGTAAEAMGWSSGRTSRA